MGINTIHSIRGGKNRNTTVHQATEEVDASGQGPEGSGQDQVLR